MKAGSSERGKEFAARWGQILSRSIRPRGAQGLLRRRQVPYGQVRPAAQVLQDLSSADSVHKGDREYRQGEQAHTELADPISGLIPLSSYLSHDFSRYPLDEPIKNVKINGVQGMYDLTVRLTRNRNLTLRDIGLEPAHTPAFGTGASITTIRVFPLPRANVVIRDHFA
jgi:hypothetical protein